MNLPLEKGQISPISAHLGAKFLPIGKKDKRTKLQPKVDSGICVGTSHQHSGDTYKILMIKGKTAGKVLTRRHVYSNERSFPARKMTPQGQKSTNFQQKDDGLDLMGLTFIDDGESFRVTGTHKEDGQIVVD
jgi:hypothetical protein